MRHNAKKSTHQLNAKLIRGSMNLYVLRALLGVLVDGIALVSSYSSYIRPCAGRLGNSEGISHNHPLAKRLGIPAAGQAEPAHCNTRGQDSPAMAGLSSIHRGQLGVSRTISSGPPVASDPDGLSKRYPK